MIFLKLVVPGPEISWADVPSNVIVLSFVVDSNVPLFTKLPLIEKSFAEVASPPIVKLIKLSYTRGKLPLAL